MTHDLTAARKNAKTETDAAAIAWAQDEIERLRDALKETVLNIESVGGYLDSRIKRAREHLDR